MKSYRALKVADAIRRELIIMFQDGALEDPRFDGVQVAQVDLAKDNSHAKIYFTVLTDPSLDPADPIFRAQMKELESALNHAAGYVRAMLAQSLNLGYTPTVRFHFDQLAVTGQRLEAILDQIHLEKTSSVDSLAKSEE